MNPRHDVQGVSPASGKTATYADLEALPANLVGQILDGEPIAFPRPSAEHSIATSSLGFQLGGPFQFGRNGPGGWWILDKPEVHLGEDVVVPDIAGWRTQRLARPSGSAQTIAPDWVCEALSPATRSLDRTRKMRLWERERVRHVWLLDPLAHTPEVFELSGDGSNLLGTWSGEDRVRVVPFEAIELELALLWPRGPSTAP